MTIKKVFSTLTIKSFDDDKREIRGVASTPGTDRHGDIIESTGAVFTLPIPLLWQHSHWDPIGQVVSATVTESGIEIVARLVTPSSDAPQHIIERLEEAWYSIKTGLVRGLSIGFSAREWIVLETGGVHFTEWDWTELSAVTVPANVDATITSVRAFHHQQQRAAIGKKAAPVVSLPSAGASAIVNKSIKSRPLEVVKMSTTAEQLAAYKAAKEEKMARMAEIMKAAGDEGVTLDAAQTEEFDTLEAEVEALEKHIARLKKMEKSLVKNAVPADQDTRMTVDVTRSTVPVRAKCTQKLEPGIAFARAAKCLALGHLEHRDAIQIARSLYGDQEEVVLTTQRLVTKAAVPPATTTDPTWASPLIGSDPIADFIEYLRPQTILGKFGQDGIPALRNIGFRLPVVGQTTGGDGYWVGETQAKPLTKFDFAGTSLEPLKVANIAVASMEVIRDSRPAADLIIRDQLAAALRERLDLDFINPAKAAVAGVSPASILYGVDGIGSSGNDADAIRRDVAALFGSFIAARNAPTSGVLIMNSVIALALSLMRNPLGQTEFPGIGMTGGVFLGLPTIVSDYVPAGIVAMVNASDIYIGDEDGIDISMSTEASLQMDDAPDNPTTGSTVLVSLWQRNLVGFRAERAINWARRRDSAVAYLTGVNWGAPDDGGGSGNGNGD